MENRQYWSIEDTKALLSIWAEEHVQRQIDAVCRNKDVIKYIVAELGKLNIQRTTVQVWEKLKKLRAQYKSIKIHNSQSGAQRKNFPFFDIMDGVLGHRPSVSGETTRDTMLTNTTVGRGFRVALRAIGPTVETRHDLGLAARAPGLMAQPGPTEALACPGPTVEKRLMYHHNNNNDH
ncbi:hypothetical protein QQF64_035911 [Cirrhinus molitorella]|uniref:Myb/SANT-like DNA-binding domain-containing protein n=1 Tax=Cirrhinus molitorella TaxID=172907 RepID=A0ABR3NH29_9TELE